MRLRGVTLIQAAGPEIVEMKVARLAVVFGSVLVASSRPTISQDLPAIDPDVASVVSGGWWSHADADGWYRVIVRTGGFEHVVSDLTLQWMRDPIGRDDPSARVVRSVLLNPCTGRLDDPVLAKRGPKWRLTVRCTDTHGNQRPTNIVLELGVPGEYSQPGR